MFHLLSAACCFACYILPIPIYYYIVFFSKSNIFSVKPIYIFPAFLPASVLLPQIQGWLNPHQRLLSNSFKGLSAPYVNRPNMPFQIVVPHNLKFHQAIKEHPLPSPANRQQRITLQKQTFQSVRASVKAKKARKVHTREKMIGLKNSPFIRSPIRERQPLLQKMFLLPTVRIPRILSEYLVFLEKTWYNVFI